MITFFKNLVLLKKTKNDNRDDFSDFFVNTNLKNKEKIIRQVLRDANAEQRELVRKSKLISK